jgi:glycosyltransferase involved in cell wall biosynthesis
MISVLMPVRDAGPTLTAALESLLAQTEPAWELIAVDDGSTDESGAILQSRARRDRRIRVVRTGRRGLVSALDTGLAVATGDLIARLDADDLCAPERLARQRHHLDSRPEIGLVASRVGFGGDARRAAGFARYVDWTNGLLTPEDIALARFVESPLVHPSVMFRRALVRMEKLAESLLVWNDSPTRLSRRDPRYDPEAFYRVKGGYLARWLAAHNPYHPAIILWGAGRVTRRRARHLVEHGVVIEAFVDIDPRRVGRPIDGRPVLPPDKVPPPGEAFVVSYVGGADARERIEARLKAAGHRRGVDYILAA